MEERELTKLFEEGAIADDPGESLEFETVEEWLAIADVVFRKKRLHELIERKRNEDQANPS